MLVGAKIDCGKVGRQYFNMYRIEGNRVMVGTIHRYGECKVEVVIKGADLSWMKEVEYV